MHQAGRMFCGGPDARSARSQEVMSWAPGLRRRRGRWRELLTPGLTSPKPGGSAIGSLRWKNGGFIGGRGTDSRSTQSFYGDLRGWMESFAGSGSETFAELIV
ncbi:hypothetical protein Q8A67_025015 [Cirrhinus molitorella]|uniref:Uncharacterized protein n=1 Tax=Cirrhinus molitorella TaxID=172907 RepID=A0AA88P7J9_9TELE|nr:hypothetical protein Q8A67_025015 [Cirrhinus molitorella]